MTSSKDENALTADKAGTGLADNPREAAMAIAHLGLEKKARDVLVLDISHLGSYADYIVLMTADSDPQMAAVADHVEMSLKKLGRRPMSVEGLRGGQWALLDYGDVVAHVFLSDAREFYDLEGLWADAKKIVVADDGVQA